MKYRAHVLSFILMAVLAACSGGESHQSSDPYSPSNGSSFLPTPSGAIKGKTNEGWSEDQINKQAKACIDGALVGDSLPNVELEIRVKKYCQCVFETVSKTYNHSQYQNSSNSILANLESSGSLDVCY